MVEMHHARNLAQLVDVLDLRDITLVVHDWGGPIGIGGLLASPEGVANLVVLNTSVFPMPSEGSRMRTSRSRSRGRGPRAWSPTGCGGLMPLGPSPTLGEPGPPRWPRGTCER
jgi:pimeloyl-ACP methyl ester carboxylesterase